MEICDSAVIPLAIAIARRAVIDYQHVLKNGDRSTYNRRELERYFRGPLFAAACGTYDPEVFMRDIQLGKAKQRAPYGGTDFRKKKKPYIRKCYLND